MQASSARLSACSPIRSRRLGWSRAGEGTPPCRWATLGMQSPCGKPPHSPWRSPHQKARSRPLSDCRHLRQTKDVWSTQDLVLAFHLVSCGDDKPTRSIVLLRYRFLFWPYKGMSHDESNKSVNNNFNFWECFQIWWHKYFQTILASKYVLRACKMLIWP